MSTKQDWPRPYNPDKWDAGWRRIFGKPEEDDCEPERPRTDYGCGCDALAARGLPGMCRDCRMEAQNRESLRADDLNDCENP